MDFALLSCRGQFVNWLIVFVVEQIGSAPEINNARNGYLTLMRICVVYSRALSLGTLSISVALKLRAQLHSFDMVYPWTYSIVF